MLAANAHLERLAHAPPGRDRKLNQLADSFFVQHLERIVGEIPNPQAPMLWLTREYLDQALQAAGRPGLGIVGIVWARAEDPNRVNAIMRTIDDMSRNSEAETACETEKSFFSNFFGSLQGFVTIVLIVTGLVALCIVFIAANTASMAVRERSGELAVLKAIGFTRRPSYCRLSPVCSASPSPTASPARSAPPPAGTIPSAHSAASWSPHR